VSGVLLHQPLAGLSLSMEQSTAHTGKPSSACKPNIAPPDQAQCVSRAGVEPDELCRGRKRTMRKRSTQIRTSGKRLAQTRCTRCALRADTTVVTTANSSALSWQAHVDMHCIAHGIVGFLARVCAALHWHCVHCITNLARIIATKSLFSGCTLPQRAPESAGAAAWHTRVRAGQSVFALFAMTAVAALLRLALSRPIIDAHILTTFAGVQFVFASFVMAAVAVLLALSRPIIDATLSAFPDGEGATVSSDWKLF
jgi:hypothetical protein